SCLPELVVAKSRVAPTTAIPAGSTTTYTITVTNNGGGAEGVRIQDQLPTGFTFVSATLSYSTNPSVVTSINNIGTPIVPAFGSYSIPGQTSATIQLTVNIPATTTPGTYNNAAQVSYLDPTRTSANPTRLVTPASFAASGTNTAYEVGGATVGGTNYNPALPNENVVVVAPNISIVKTVPQTCMVVGTSVDYTITVTNQSANAISGITVNDVIPTGLTVTGTSNSATWVRSNTGNNNTFVYTGSLAAGATSSFNITVQAASIPASGNWSNTATVTGGGSSTVLLYAAPNPAATASASPSNACSDGTFYVNGNTPAFGTGRWEFVTAPPAGVVITNPTQTNTAVTGVPSGSSVQVRWVITNGTCVSNSTAVTLTNNTVLPIAVMSVEGGASPTVCGNATLPNLAINFTGIGTKTFRYTNPAGLVVEIVTTNNPYIITGIVEGVYSLNYVNNGTCIGTASGTVVIARSAATVAGTIATAQSICYNTSPATLTLS
ncbi:MAG: DUF11 domain-containing protein, partial [Sphingobacteriales bacterium]